MGTPSVSSCLFPPQARSVLGAIGQVALTLFMFLVGLELDFALLRGKAKGIISVALGVVALPVALGFAIGPTLYNTTFAFGFDDPATRPTSVGFTLMVSAMLAVTAFPVMARILQEKGLTLSPMGSVGIAAAAVVTVLMFLVVLLGAGVARGAGAGELGLRLAAAVGYVAAMLLVVRPALAPLGRAYRSAGTLTQPMFGAVLALVIASAAAAHILGVNVIVGGFLAGIVVPAPRKELYTEFATRLYDLTGVVLLPIFLAFSGLNTDFTRLSRAALPGLALFLVAGIVGKWLGGAFFARLGGLSWAEGNVLGILMNCRGLLILVAALAAVNANVISPILQVGAVLMALITTMMTGPLFDRFLPGATRAAVPPGSTSPSASALG
jgi:Kef-type K+ transport system membrane component KefB